jgi:hypothetical protein
MSNMSAQILRNLVSSVFGIDAKTVVLSGEIAANYTTDNSCSYGCMYTSQREEKLFGFNPGIGFVELSTNVKVQTSNADGSWNGHMEVFLPEVSAVNEYIFFVSIGSRFYSAEQAETTDEKFCKLYKAPNFKEYFDKIEAEDIARWEQWINS